MASVKKRQITSYTRVLVGILSKPKDELSEGNSESCYEQAAQPQCIRWMAKTEAFDKQTLTIELSRIQTSHKLTRTKTISF